MGIRVGFYFGGPDGLLSAFLDSPLDQFQDWLAEVLAEFPEDVSPSSLQLVEDIKRSGIPALTRATEINYMMVDVLVSDWILFVDVSHRFKLESASDSWVNIRHYEELHKEFERRELRQVSKMFSYIRSGRPLIRDEATYPFYSEDEVLKVGYWTAEEVKSLRITMQKLEREAWWERIRENGVLGIVQEVVDGAAQKNTGIVFVVC